MTNKLNAIGIYADFQKGIYVFMKIKKMQELFF